MYDVFAIRKKPWAGIVEFAGRIARSLQVVLVAGLYCILHPERSIALLVGLYCSTNSSVAAVGPRVANSLMTTWLAAANAGGTRVASPSPTMADTARKTRGRARMAVPFRARWRVQ